MHKMWFQKDEPLAHTARVTIEMLKTVFQNRLISCFGDVPWAPRPPDLTPLDIFLWGYLKKQVYLSIPRNLFELKENVIQEIGKVSPDI